jgi:hypothetical protein
MYGGDPGFAFEYGGSWADWHDQHRNTMPVEQYIQTKLPKARLPFREMQSGGRIGYAEGKSYESWLNYRLKEIAKGNLPVPFKEWQKGDIKMASGGLAYMLGEPTYSVGGSVGHAPWHKPTAQQQPQQQLDTPTKHGPGIHAATDDATSDDGSRKHGPRTKAHG